MEGRLGGRMLVVLVPLPDLLTAAIFCVFSPCPVPFVSISCFSSVCGNEETRRKGRFKLYGKLGKTGGPE